MERELLLKQLPKYQHKYKMISPTQTVTKIRRQLLKSHEENAQMYDRIASQFSRRSMQQTFENLWTWLKENIQYVEEDEKRQTIKTPQALVETGVSDCKGLASFVGGVLDAIKRTGRDFDWRYVFAGYGDTNHVFVEADAGGRTWWIDPVLKEFDQREPKPLTIRKFERDMALYTLSGVGCGSRTGYPGRMGMTMMQAPQDCILPYESIDEQMMRLSKCQSGGGGTIVPFDTAQDLYDLPLETALPLTSPIDAMPIDPGEPQTMNPAPAPAPGPSPASDTGVVGWITENPILAALIGAGIMYAVTRDKKKRRKRA